MSISISLFLLAFLSLLGVPSFAESDIELRSLSKSCVSYIEELKKNPSISYGWIRNTEHNASIESEVNVFYQAKIVRDKNGSIVNPVIFYNGGPGFDSHSVWNTLADLLTSNPQTSLITMDQRGNGCSSLYPKFQNDLDLSVSVLSAYGSRMIVSDSEVLRKHLNLEKWTVFGQSYGGLIVQRYLELNPSSVSKAVMHGTPIGAWTDSIQKERFSSIAGTYRKFSAANPGFQQKVDEIAHLLPDTHCIYSVERFVSVCGEGILSLFAPYLRAFNRQDLRDGFEQQINSLHKALSGGLDVRDARLTEYLSAYLNWTVGTDDSRFFWEQVITKQEFTPGFTDSLNGARLTPLDDPLISESSLFRSYIFSNKSFENVNVDPIDVDTVKLNVVQQDIDFYVFASEIDVISPANQVQEQVEGFLDTPNVKFLTFKDSGHEGFSTETEIFKVLKKVD